MLHHIARVSHRLLPAVLLTGLTLALPIVAQEECPTSTVSCWGADCCYPVKVFDLSDSSTGPTLAVSYDITSASCNLEQGVVEAVIQVDSIYMHVSEATAADRFTLHGVPSATLTVRLNLSMTMVTDPSGRMAWASGWAQLSAGALSVSAQNYGPNIVPYIELEVPAVEDVPFELVYETEATGSGYYPYSSMTCRLEFVDPPQGASITSCNGYSPTPVPAEEATWGSVKALYH